MSVLDDEKFQQEYDNIISKFQDINDEFDSLDVTYLETFH